MRRFLSRFIALGCVWMGAAAAQAATVEVRFIDPGNYADAGRDVRSREEVQAALSRYLQTLGAQLPGHQLLRIDVLDIDLAGELEPFHRAWPELRVMRGRTDWPRITLRYTLLEGGQVIVSAQERVSDMAYLMPSRLSSREGGDAYGYEKVMLARWFQARFGPSR